MRNVAVPLVLVLLALALLPNVVPVAAADVAPSLHFAAAPIRLAVDCVTIPVTMLVLRPDTAAREPVTEVTVQVDGNAVREVGQWRALTADPSTIRDLRQLWPAFSRPGHTTESESSAAHWVQDTARGLAGHYDAITVNVPAPTSMKPGYSFEISASVLLSDGSVATAETYALAEATTAPADWVLGDCHMHSATFSDGCLTLP